MSGALFTRMKGPAGCEANADRTPGLACVAGHRPVPRLLDWRLDSATLA